MRKSSLDTPVWQISKAKKFSLLLFSQELLSLLNAGLTIVEALEVLLDKEQSQNTRAILSSVLNGLSEGKRFSQVLSEQEEYFPVLFVGIVQASESTSNLPASLARFVEYQQRIDAVRNKIISSLIYPIILFVVGGWGNNNFKITEGIFQFFLVE
ncbi:type II secretion system F family protein [Undibacterium griseum]|uniref:Type II secretion system F family protein n=1 Tax=Undibacterium griseum TaxID=2762295 RepID=A0ABR6YRP8_9BURK|nr:type II secretion system F family protein [Undibacterium griseum]MBC3886572.1 type II secretion system F family protein [Undibacterium griseum]